ncbi:MAG: hypothetical protein ACI89J_002712, partial [Hyphomicrobiaceae bacterium]
MLASMNSGICPLLIEAVTAVRCQGRDHMSASSAARRFRRLSWPKSATAGIDAVDGSSRRHLDANMVAVEATSKRGADHERYY